MPSKIQLDENLWFLYICLQKSDMKSIDFAAVASATSLKGPAARMRYTRLRRQIESGTLTGRDGLPFSLAAPTDSPSGKAKRGRKRKCSESGGHAKEEDDSDEGHRDGRANRRGSGSGSGFGFDGGGGSGGMKEMKKELKREEYWSGGSEGDDDDFGDRCWGTCEESEDEMPLAKLRGRYHPSPHHYTHNATPAASSAAATLLPMGAPRNTYANPHQNGGFILPSPQAQSLPPPTATMYTNAPTTPRYLPPQSYGFHHGGHVGMGIGMGMGLGMGHATQWFDYEEAARAWERARDWQMGRGERGGGGVAPKNSI